MAGDWLKVRMDLHEEPEILHIAHRLKTRPEHVVGYCVRFWGWASRTMSPEERDRCPAASVTGVPLEEVESVLNLPGFCHYLVEVGWLEYENADENHVIHVPNFERHLSESAKKRALDAEKKRKQRSSARPESVPKKRGQVSPKNEDKTGTREEKRREEKSIKKETKAKKERGRGGGGGGGGEKFVPPTAEQVAAYCLLKGYQHVKAEAFIAYYESQGWKKGNGLPVVSWRGCVLTFEERAKKDARGDANERNGSALHREAVERAKRDRERQEAAEQSRREAARKKQEAEEETREELARQGIQAKLRGVE